MIFNQQQARAIVTTCYIVGFPIFDSVSRIDDVIERCRCEELDKIESHKLLGLLYSEGLVMVDVDFTQTAVDIDSNNLMTHLHFEGSVTKGRFCFCHKGRSGGSGEIFGEFQLAFDNSGSIRVVDAYTRNGMGNAIKNYCTDILERLNQLGLRFKPGTFVEFKELVKDTRLSVVA